MCRRRRSSSGFTLMELMIVAGMTSLLAVLFSMAWSGLGQPSADALIQCQVVQEAQLAVASLAADFGGSLAGQAEGEKLDGQLVGRMVVADSELWLCFDGGNLDGAADWGAPDTVITYAVEENQLVRSDSKTKTAFVVASNVERMRLDEQGTGVEIELTFHFRDLTRTYTLIAKDP